MTEVKRIVNQEDLEHAYEVRRLVYIEEQQIREEDEFDEYDSESTHYLALLTGKPCGAARWRRTTEGIKLERFAVLPEFRKKGVGSALVEKVLQDVRAAGDGAPIYLNAQLNAMSLYSKFNFKPVGETFSECDIEHVRMEFRE